MKNTSGQYRLAEFGQYPNNYETLRIMLDAFKNGLFSELDDLLGLDASSANIMIRRKLEILNFSIKAKIGVDVNLKTSQGMTPLHMAASIGCLNIAEKLIENAAVIDVKNNKGMTPLHMAILKGHTDTAKFLIFLNADISIKDNSGKAPIHYAAFKRNFEVVKCLIENGANCNFTSNTPVDESLSNYIEFGDFLQSMCSARSGSLTTEKQKAIESLLRQNPDIGPLMEFARLTMKNYALKLGASNGCLQKIEDCSILPEVFKTALVQTMAPLFITIKQSLEASGWQPLFTDELFDHDDLQYFEAQEIPLWKTDQSETKPLGDINQVLD